MPVQTRFRTTINGNISDVQTTCVLAAAPAFTTGFCTWERGTANEEDGYWGNLSGLQLTGLLRGLSKTALTVTEVAGNKRPHLNAAVFEATLLHYIVNNKADLDEDETVTGNWVFTGNIGFSNAPKVPGLKDANGNETIDTPATASAVNQLKVINAATGNAVQITAAGGDTNIDVHITGKGTGRPKLQDGSETDTNAAPTTDKGVVNKKYVDDILNNLAYGGDGSDGVLDTSGGVVNINLGGLSFVVKQYSSVNIATNNVTVSNAHPNGTVLLLKCKGDMTLSSIFDGRSGGASGGAGGVGGVGDAQSGTDGTDGSNTFEPIDGANHNGKHGNGATYTVVGAAGAAASAHSSASNILYGNPKRFFAYVVPGAGGAGGGAGSSGSFTFAYNPGSGGDGGIGGAGALALIVEVRGILNFTGNVNLNGSAGANGVAGHAAIGSGGGGGGGGGGGAGGSGGGGGMCIFTYNNQVAVSGTISVSGGSAGSVGVGGAAAGGVVGGGRGGGGSSGAGGYSSASSAATAGSVNAGGVGGASGASTAGQDGIATLSKNYFF